ncbi:hypothetical protein FRC10_011236 [Ceratobasidium sp. 414]|nr:hypothetical protein FRC10_011236 [Ceratobasidium sp. 414]
MSTRQHSSLFLHINTSPNPDANPALWEHRLRQRRPISQNPFESENSSSRGGYGLARSDSPPTSPTRRLSSKYEEGKLGYNVAGENVKRESVNTGKRNADREWGDQIPSWLNLFYDLAWTATFSSLTSSKLRGYGNLSGYSASIGAEDTEIQDSVSYIVFFTTAWWLWASQVFYSAEFYTDDWFHVLLVFLQLVIFGALASATRGKRAGFDITNYILHSPGSDNLEPYDIDTITPDRYGAERLTKVSVRVVMISISISRALLLVQHLRVAIYAKITSRTKRYPLKLFIVPASLVISATLFFVAFRIAMNDFGRTPQGAKIKYILWGVAILVEVIAHIGINAIAGTFYAIEKAPGFSGPTGAGIVCCAIIVFFLAYLYFNGAAPLKSVRRRAAWVMMHLPWLLTVILLLEGVKNQLLLQSFMASGLYMQTKIADNVFANVSMDQFNVTMRPVLLQGGMSYNEEFADYMGMVQKNFSSNPNAANLTEDDIDSIVSEILGVWYLRLQLKGTLNTYITFMDNSSIPDTTQQTIGRYLGDYNYTLKDYQTAMTTNGDIPVFFQIMNELMDPSLGNIRYIMAMCGGTFITLASLNLIQSWPRDRFHWASIFSRYAIGIAMLLLLLLNLGKSQAYLESVDTPMSQRAGILRWLDA